MKKLKKNKLSIRAKRFILSGGLLSTLIFLSACSFDQDGQPKGFLSEITYNVFVLPLTKFLEILHGAVGSYGIAIILFTLIFRLVLLPMTFKQQRSQIENQIKMAAVQPITAEIQAEMKATDDKAEQQALNMELMEIYRENNIGIGSQLAGCFPLLLQMPIFVAMFQVLRNSKAIENASFLGMPLGETSVVLAVITGLVYFLQSRLMIQAMPEEQQKTAGTTMYITPVMMGFIGFSSPAAISLYWMMSGVFSLGQQIFNNYYYKPKIEAEVREEVGDFKVTRKRKPAQNVTVQDEPINKVNNTNRSERNNRNAGKQQRNRK